MKTRSLIFLTALLLTNFSAQSAANTQTHADNGHDKTLIEKEICDFQEKGTLLWEKLVRGELNKVEEAQLEVIIQDQTDLLKKHKQLQGIQPIPPSTLQ